MHMMKVGSKLFGGTPSKFMQTRGSGSGSPNNSSPTNKVSIKMLPLHKLLDSAKQSQQRALTDRSNNYSNIKQSKQSTIGKCNYSIVFNENSYTTLNNKVQRKRNNQSPLTNMPIFRNEKPFTPQSIYKQEYIPSPKPVQKVCIDLVDPKRLCKEHNLKVRFTAEDGTELCEICSVREAYNGVKMVHIERQLHLQPKPSRSYESSDLDTISIPSDGLSEELFEKRQAIQEFLMYISTEKDQTHKRINVLESLLCTNRLSEHNKNVLEDIQVDLASLLKSFLETSNASGLSMQGKLAIKENISQLKTTLNDLTLIKTDILSNVQNILTHMDLGPCRQILSKYKQKVDNYRVQLNHLALQLSERFGIQDYLTLKDNLILSEESQQTWKSTMNSLLKPSKLNLRLSFGASDDKTKEEEIKPKQNKFLNLLDKINSSQSQKNCFLSSIMASEPNSKALCLSPQFRNVEQNN